MIKRAKPTTEVFETATSDDGMTKKDAAMFHAWNPNGAVASLPDYSEFIFGDKFASGPAFMWSQAESWCARQLVKIAAGDKKTFSHRDVQYYVAEIKKERVEFDVWLAKREGGAA
tara:strand:+ start:131 stop:475 length:345 start_codon:yes stop_codon:yes gene_type:complete